MAEVISFLILFFYSLLLMSATFYIQRKRKEEALIFHPKVVVLVPFRNEAKNLHKVFLSVLAQDYQNYELIGINDHSEDDYQEYIKDIKDERFKIMQLPMGVSGKKQAIEYAIHAIETELVLITDADCWMGKKWISSMVTKLISDNKDWVAGAVKINAEEVWIQKFQQLESAYLVLLSAFTIAINKPTTCNGANILFSKQKFLSVGGFSGLLKTPSGDDELLMQKFYSKNMKLGYCLSNEAVVSTKAEKNINHVISQRIRWGSKLKYNLLRNNLWLSILVFSMHLSTIALLFFNWKITIVFILVRFVVELVTAKFTFNWLKQDFSLFHFIISFFVYPLYAIFMSIATQTKGYQWKGRKY